VDGVACWHRSHQAPEALPRERRTG
jgi:hypothetical protein